MATDAIQIIGIQGVLDAYKKASIAPWASCKGNKINCKYEDSNIDEGAAILQEWLERLRDFNSMASYELRLYEDLPKGGKIRVSTQDYISFTYSLKERVGDQLSGSQYPVAANMHVQLLREVFESKSENYKLQFDLDKLQEQVEALEDELAKKEKSKSAEQKSMGMVFLEAYAPKLMDIGGRIADRIADSILPAKSNALAGIVLENGTIDEDKAIYDAVMRLKKSVNASPGLPAIMTKLADFSEKNPWLFNTYVGQLMRMG